MDEDFTAASRADFVVITIQALDYIALSINVLSNRNVDPDVTVFGNLDQDSVLHFKIIMRHIVSTKDSTDVVKLKKLPKSTQQNNTVFKNWINLSSWICHS